MKTVGQLTSDELGDIIKKAVISAMMEVHEQTDEKKKLANRFAKQLMHD